MKLLLTIAVKVGKPVALVLISAVAAEVVVSFQEQDKIQYQLVVMVRTVERQVMAAPVAKQVAMR